MKFEIGYVEINTDILDGGYTDVVFKHLYIDPIVVCYIYTFDGSDEVEARAMNITSTGCRLLMVEPPAFGITHYTERVCYMVMEAGVGEFSDGTKVEAGKFDTSSVHTSGSAFGGPTTNFNQTFSSPPVLLHSLGTFNNNAFMATVTSTVTSTYFICQQEAGNSGVSSTTETIHWIAIESGKTGTINGLDYETSRGNDGSNDGKNDTPHTITYVNTYDYPPLIIAKGASGNGTAGYFSRGAFHWRTKHGIYAYEAPGDGNHADETFSWFVIQDHTNIPFYEEEPKIRNIWADNNYIYKPTISGVFILNTSTGALIDYIYTSSPVNSVWANNSHIYMATNGEGIYRANSSEIGSGPTASGFRYDNDITSNTVRYIHGNGNYLTATTVSGVDHYYLDSTTHYHIDYTYANKCYQTSVGSFYYSIKEELSEGFLYSRTITLDTPTQLPNYQVQVDLSGVDNTKSNNQESIRFYSTNGTKLPYWIPDNASYAWVKVIDSGTSNFKLLYGNSNLVSESSAYDTLDGYFYPCDDDFSFPDDYWAFSSDGAGNYSIINGECAINMDGVGPDLAYLRFTRPIEGSFYISYQVRITNNNVDTDHELRVETKNESNGTTNRGIYIGAYNGTNEYPHRMYTEGGTIQGAQLLSYTTYRNENFYIDSTESKSIFNGETLLYNRTSWDMPTYGNLALRFGGTYQTLRLRAIQIRKYVNPEPIITTGVEETHPVELHAVYNNTSDWDINTVGYAYDVLDEAFSHTTLINDIFVTENTSQYSGQNVLFSATDNGVVLIEESFE